MANASSVAKVMGLDPLAGHKDTYFGVKSSLHAGDPLAVLLVITPSRRTPGHFHFRITVAGRHEISGYGDAGKVQDSLFWAMILYESADMQKETT
jgi:hypothetical protein